MLTGFNHVLRSRLDINLSLAIIRSINTCSVTVLRRFGETGCFRCNRNFITYIPVGFQHILPFIGIGKVVSDYRLLTTESSHNEDEVTEEVLYRILTATENVPKSAKEVCSLYIDKLLKAGNLFGAERLLKSLREKDVFLHDAYNRLLVAAADRNDFDLSFRIFKIMYLCSRFLNSECYLNFARAFTSTTDSMEVLRVIEEVAELAAPKSIVVLNRIMFAFAQSRQIEKALLIFHHMKEWEYKPDLITYNISLHVLGQAGRVNEMLHEFASMRDVGIIPDFISYNTLLNNLRKRGRLDLCLVFLKEMGDSGIQPDLLTYTALIESFGRSGNIDESLRLFGDMKVRHIRPSIYIYRSLINNLKKMGKIDLAVKLLEEMNSSLSNLAGPKDFKRKSK